MSLVNYGPAGLGPISQATVSTFNTGAYNNGTQSYVVDTLGSSGVYKGSLSAQGNMVAMQLNRGAYTVVKTGKMVEQRVKQRDEESGRLRFITIEVEEEILVPYCTGYMRQYFKDPRTCTFGADSAMPALTGVMPVSLTETQGNFLFYVDLQLTRLSGSNYFDSFYFINSFNQAISWVTTCNNYLAALKTAEQRNLAYFNAKNYKELITQGFAKYKQGSALRQAFRNIGVMPESISTGKFGTPNAVVNTLIKLGLGSIGKISDTLYVAGVNFANIYDSAYTAIITETLSKVTNPADLKTIQDVVQSSIPNMVSPMDYCSIEAAAGLPNDSVFKDFAEVGLDLVDRSPNITLTLGADIANLIDDLQDETGANVEDIATPTSLLTPEIIANLRRILPLSVDNKPVTILNIIGTASGYLIDDLTQVDSGLAQLYATPYGPQIRTLLSDISRYAARFPTSQAEINAIDSNPDWWTSQLDSKINEYYALLRAMTADTSGDIPRIVRQINDNYLSICTKLNYEVQNYNKANFTVSSFHDNTSILSFVSSLPSFAEDSQNIATDYMMYNMAANNPAGDLVKTLMGESKNSSIFSQAAVPIKDIL